MLNFLKTRKWACIEDERFCFSWKWEPCMTTMPVAVMSCHSAKEPSSPMSPKQTMDGKYSSTLEWIFKSVVTQIGKKWWITSISRIPVNSPEQNYNLIIHVNVFIWHKVQFWVGTWTWASWRTLYKKGQNCPLLLILCQPSTY